MAFKRFDAIIVHYMRGGKNFKERKNAREMLACSQKRFILLVSPAVKASDNKYELLFL